MDVSVVMAVKNEEIYIGDAAISIINQNGLNHELIVVNDGSTDKTSFILQELTEQFDNLHVFDNPKQGKVSAFNFGFTKAKGKFICLFAGDDIMPEGSLLERFNLVKAYSEEKCVGLSKIRILSEDKSVNGQIVPRTKGKGNTTGQSPLMSKLVINELFPVPEQFPNEDTWMEAYMLYYNQVKIIHSDTICCNWRIHDRNSFNANMPHKKYKDNIMRRNKAFELFLQKWELKLDEENKNRLKAKVELDNYYANSQVLRIIFSRARMMDKIRSLSTVTKPFYFLRNRLYWILKLI